MPHSLRAKLKYLTICGHIRKKDYERLCKALDNEGVLDKIREEIQKEKEAISFNLNEEKARWTNGGIYDGLTWAQEIIDKYREEKK